MGSSAKLAHDASGCLAAGSLYAIQARISSSGREHALRCLANRVAFDHDLSALPEAANVGDFWGAKL
jgi:hypothetical protein